MDGGGIAQCIHSSLHWQFANKAALFIRMPAPSLGTSANDVSQNVLSDLLSLLPCFQYSMRYFLEIFVFS